MLRSSKRYQKQTRDALRKQNSQSRYQKAMNNLNAVAAEGKAKKASEAAYMRTPEGVEERARTIDELERLARLYTEGALTAKEYTQAKKKLLY